MATEVASLFAKIGADTTGFERAMRGVQGTLGKVGGTMKAAIGGAGIAAGVALAGAAVGAIAYSKDAIGAASDLNETISKTNVVLGDASYAVQAWSKTTNTALGMSRQSALDAASTFATFGKAAGLGGEDLSAFSMDLTTLAADLGSFYNTSPEQAIGAIGAALRGESEPIRAYGVLLDDATLRQRALTMGIVDNVNTALTPQQRALAATAELFAQTTDAQGDFARTSGGLAGQQKILAASLTDVQTTIGTALLPAMTSLVTAANDLLVRAMPGIKDFAETQLAPAIEGIAAAIKPDVVIEAINSIIGGFEYWANAAIGTYDDMLLGLDMFVTGFYNGINSIIGAINAGIEGLNTFDTAMRQLAAGAALLRGDVVGAYNLSQPGIKIPALPEVKRSADSYFTNDAMDFVQLDRIPTTANATRDADAFSDAIRGVGVESDKAGDSQEYLNQKTGQTGQTAGGAASGGLSALERKFNDIVSATQSVIDEAMNLGVVWQGMDGGGGGDAINENAKRLAAIANEGLIGQDWLGEFASEAPSTYADLMLKIAAGMNPQAAAQQLMSEFQAGMRPDLLDQGMIKERVKAMILGDAAAADMAKQIAAEIAAEMNISMPEALAAANTALGVSGSGASGTDQFGAGFTEGVDAQATAAGTLAQIAKAFVDNETNVRTAGGTVGAWWGEGFMATVGANVPSGLLDMLFNKLFPAIMAAITARNSQTGTTDGATP